MMKGFMYACDCRGSIVCQFNECLKVLESNSAVAWCEVVHAHLKEYSLNDR